MQEVVSTLSSTLHYLGTIQAATLFVSASNTLESDRIYVTQNKHRRRSGLRCVKEHARVR